MTAPLSRRKRERVFAWLGAALALAAAIAAMHAFNLRTQPVFAQRAHPILHQAALHAHPEIPRELSSMVPDNEPPLFRLSNLTSAWLGDNYAAYMAAQLVLFAAFVGACAAIGFRVRGRRGAAWTAAFAAWLPAAHFAALGYDDHLFNMTLTALAVACVIGARGARLVAGAFLAGAFAGIALRYAFIGSNGLLVAAAVASAIVGAAVDAFGTQDAAPEPRARTLAFGTGALAVFGIAAAIFAARGGSLEYLSPGYYGGEVGNAPFSGFVPWLRSLAAYPLLLMRFHWGVPLTACVLVALWTHFERRLPGRFALAAWLLMEIVALSAIPKKHQWYIDYALIAAAPIAGVASAYWRELGRESRAGRVAVPTLLAACVAWAAWGLARPSPAWMQAAFMDIVMDERGRSLMMPITVTSDAADEAGALSALTRSRRGADEPRVLVVLDWVGPLEEFRYEFALRDRALRLYVVGAAVLPPPSGKPFLVYPRRHGEDAPPPLPELVERTIGYVEARIAEGAAPVDRLPHLYDLRARAGEFRVVHEGPDLVVYDTP
ncbi:MAG: hypothetical protein IT350_16625 [Deltaproteobacteria bacterium]|nr:hypothetical protein [Deltaproteobacteria bacterium]